MSAHSFITHRMFVAALSNETAPTGAEARGPARQERPPEAVAAAANFHGRPRQQPSAGVLLVNAMVNGFQPTAS